MKIDDSHKPGDASAGIVDKTVATERKARPRRGQKEPLPVDGVHLSPRAREYQKARQALGVIPDTDVDKVREIKDRIQTGHYRLDADKIAEKIIRVALTSDD